MKKQIQIYNLEKFMIKFLKLFLMLFIRLCNML